MPSIRIKLFSPPVQMSFPANTRLPLGMGILTASLRKAGYSVDQDDLNARVKEWNSRRWPLSGSVINPSRPWLARKVPEILEKGISDPELDRFAGRLLALSPWRDYGLLGFSIHCKSGFIYSRLLAEKIRKENGPPVAFGGPFITLYARRLLQTTPVDYMVEGDGRLPLRRLAETLEAGRPAEGIPGLHHRSNGKHRFTPRTDSGVEDMPLPDFEGLPIDAYRQAGFEDMPFLPYQVGRGCDGACAFCTFRMVDDSPAMKSPEKVARELREYTRRYGSRFLSLCDTAFNRDPDSAKRVCDAIAAQRLDLSWEAFVRARRLDKELLVKMREAGCTLVKIGIESGSGDVLRRMGKGISVADAEKALRLCEEVGVNVRAYFIVGYPHETDADVDQTIRFIRSNAERIQSFSLYRFRMDIGSFIEADAAKHRVKLLRPRLTIFEFDEQDGLAYEEFCRRQERSEARILEAVYEALLRGYGVGRAAFRLYLLCERALRSALGRSIFRSLPHRLQDCLHLMEPRYFGGILTGNFGTYLGPDIFPFQRGSRSPHQYAHFKKRGPGSRRS